MNTTRLLLWAVLIGLVLVASSVFATTAVEPTLMLRLADQHRADTEYGAAIDVYEELIDLRPDWAAPRVRLGQIYLAQGRWAEAQSAFVLALENNSSDTHALGGLAEVAHHRGELQTAVELWRRALAVDPSDLEARYRLSQVYVEMSRFSEAEDELYRVLCQDRNHQAAHYALGTILATENPAQALDHLRVAASGEEPSLALRAAEMVDILTGGDTSIAEAQVADRLARWCLRNGMPSLALRQLERLTDAYPGNYTARAYLGYALFSLGRYDLARDTLREVTQLSPENPLGYYFLGVLHRSEGYYATALWDLKRSLLLDPSNAAAYAAIADTYTRLGQYVTAEEWYRAATSVAPEEPGFPLLLAEFYLEVMPRPREALSAATEAARLAPDDPATLDLLGWAYLMAGDADTAKIVLERSLALDPNLASAYYHLAVVCQELGDDVTAEWAFQRTIDLDADGTYREKALKQAEAGGS
jgi:tetratricopeptide (TPR) repeat protein